MPLPIPIEPKPIGDLWRLLETVELVQVRPQEMEPLYRHCYEFEKPTIIEIGSAHGASSIILAEAAKDTGGYLICIDNFVEGYEGQDKFGDYARRAFKRNTNAYKQYLYLFDMDSSVAKDRVLRKAEAESISVILIDGDHSYEGVKNDCQNYLPLLKSGGYVAFHDYNNVAFSGVKKAADEFTGNWEKTDDVWDLIIRKKP